MVRAARVSSWCARSPPNAPSRLSTAMDSGARARLAARSVATASWCRRRSPVSPPVPAPSRAPRPSLGRLCLPTADHASCHPAAASPPVCRRPKARWIVPRLHQRCATSRVPRSTPPPCSAGSTCTTRRRPPLPPLREERESAKRRSTDCAIGRIVVAGQPPLAGNGVGSRDVAGRRFRRALAPTSTTDACSARTGPAQLDCLRRAAAPVPCR